MEIAATKVLPEACDCGLNFVWQRFEYSLGRCWFRGKRWKPDGSRSGLDGAWADPGGQTGSRGFQRSRSIFSTQVATTASTIFRPCPALAVRPFFSPVLQAVPGSGAVETVLFDETGADRHQKEVSLYPAWSPPAGGLASGGLPAGSNLTGQNRPQPCRDDFGFPVLQGLRPDAYRISGETGQY